MMTRLTFLPVLGALGLGAGLACQGSAGPGGAGATGTAAGGAAAGGSASSVPLSAEECASVPLDPGSAYLRRLNNVEYAAAVHDHLGSDTSALVQDFPDDLTAREVNRGWFDNVSENQTISSLHAQRYAGAAEQLATDIATDPARSTTVLGCDAALAGPACLAAGLDALGLKLYRRPLLADEKAQLVALANTETDGAEAAKLVLQAMLLSPSFLFRVEEGVGADAARPELVKLSGYEVATRLSFFFLGRAPDQALLGAAQQGLLDTPEGVESAARGLLDDARLRQSFQSFAEQWFRTRRLHTAQRDLAQFPLFSSELVAAMQQEFSLLLDEHVFGADSNFLDLYTTRAGYVNDALAPLYGVTAPGSGQLVRVDFADNLDRGGLFTTGALLTSTVRGNETSVIHRGVYVRDVVLCSEVPGPPEAVTPPEVMAGESALDAEQRHTQDPVCAACHELINPVGHGLERYDSIGALRETYATGAQVLLDGYIAGLTPEANYAGGVELGRIVRQSPEASRCVVKHAFRWAMGRFEHDASGAPEDSCTVHRLEQVFVEKGSNFRELIVALATSDVFRYRRPKEQQE